MKQPVCKHCGKPIIGEPGWEKHVHNQRFLCEGQTENVAEVPE